jgi:hypothetical protein
MFNPPWGRRRHAGLKMQHIFHGVLVEAMMGVISKMEAVAIFVIG